MARSSTRSASKTPAKSGPVRLSPIPHTTGKESRRENLYQSAAARLMESDGDVVIPFVDAKGVELGEILFVYAPGLDAMEWKSAVASRFNSNEESDKTEEYKSFHRRTRVAEVQGKRGFAFFPESYGTVPKIDKESPLVLA